MEKHSAKSKVLVTGGISGIGLAIVKKLAASGYDLVITFNQAISEAAQLEENISRQYPGQAFEFHKADFKDKSQVTALAAKLSEQPAFYGFIHNAGYSYDTLAALVDQDQAEDLMQVNFWSMTALVKAILRPMLSERNGRIIAMGSVTALRGVSKNTVYAASKGAMMSYIRSLAIEIAKRGVCANYIASGFVDTGLLEPYFEYRKEMEKQIPLQRFAQPGEIADLVAFLLSPSASYMTGSIIQIDGGLDANLSVQR